MKRMILCAAFAASCGSLLAQDAPAGCTDSMLQGTYAASISGMAPAPAVVPGSSALPGTIQSLIGLVLMTFDGKGTFTQSDWVKGTLSPYVSARPGKGVYKVNADCTGTSTISIPGAPFDIVTQFILTDNGKGSIFIVATPATIMTMGSSHRVR